VSDRQGAMWGFIRGVHCIAVAAIGPMTVQGTRGGFDIDPTTCGKRGGVRNTGKNSTGGSMVECISVALKVKTREHICTTYSPPQHAAT
jgi:hypothetical protein